MKEDKTSELAFESGDHGREDIGRFARQVLALRQWERQHMPTEGTQLGFEVFVKMAELVVAGGEGGLLKRLYLALPYSEKGIRLHLRRLESGGWIRVHRLGADGRGAQIEPSAAYWKVLMEYAAQWPGATWASGGLR